MHRIRIQQIRSHPDGPSRRALLLAAGLVPPAFGQPQPKSARIESLETFRVRVNQRGNWIVARLRTSQGITGLGDASHGGSDSRTISFLEEFYKRCKGRSAFEVESLRSELFPAVEAGGRNAAVAFGALEQCLWDIQGQILQVPVSSLFGGAIRREIRNYANINRSTEPRTPEGFARMARAAVEAGFDAVKLAPFDGMPKSDAAAVSRHIRQALDCIRAVRGAIGPARDLLVDVHSTLNLEQSLAVARQLEPLNLFWLEEVTPRLEDLAEFNRAVTARTAGGESIFGLRGFYRYIRAGAVDVTMPDIKYCGGMWEMKKIAALSEAAELDVSPHGPASPVGNVAAAHVSATLPNFLILEYAFGEVPWRAELIEPPETMVGGHLVLSGKPGFGIRLNEKVAARHAA